MRGCDDRYFIRRIAHRGCGCLTGPPPACPLASTPPLRGCTRNHGRYPYRPIRPRLGQGRSADFHPLGAWTGLPPLSLRLRSRSSAVERSPVDVRWLSFPGFLRTCVVSRLWALCRRAGDVTAAHCDYRRSDPPWVGFASPRRRTRTLHALCPTP